VNVTAIVPNGVFASALSVRGGLGLTVPLVTSQPAVGTLRPAVLTFNPGDNRGTVTFTPTATGNAILTITQPAGFVNSPSLAQFVVVVN
jgi:hypothetical protein